MSRVFNREQSLQYMVLRQVDIHIQKSEVESLAHTIYKIHQKWIGGPNLRAKTYSFLRRKQINLRGLGFSGGFLETTSKAKATKEEKDKLDFIKIKDFYASKDSIKEVKR